jgi:ankyrin repeat protein
MNLRSDEPVAAAVVAAIQSGDLAALRRLLSENPGLSTAKIIDTRNRCAAGEIARTLLHVATDWPGHFPNSAATMAAMIASGAEVNARFTGPHIETPLHWAASSDDVEALDVLLDHGADIEAPGAVIGGGTPLADAVAFGQWKAARRLLERGARTTLWQAAALGLLDRVEEYFARDTPPAPDEITNAFWCACHGGQRGPAEYLLGRGAELNWIGYDKLTPIDAARRSGAQDVAEWLSGQGARPATELR